MHPKAMLLVATFFAITSMAGAQQQQEKLNIVQTYKMTISNDKKPKLKTDYIADAEEWNRVYRVFSAEGKIPQVDFTKHFVVVSTHDKADPNRRGVTIVKNAKGTVAVRIISTLIGFQPSNETVYTFYVVPRAGVTGVERYDRETKKNVVDPFPK